MGMILIFAREVVVVLHQRLPSRYSDTLSYVFLNYSSLMNSFGLVIKVLVFMIGNKRSFLIIMVMLRYCYYWTIVENQLWNVNAVKPDINKSRQIDQHSW